MKTRAAIAGTGSHLPDKVLTNDDLARIVNTSDQWIRERTGIKRRHIAGEGETCCDLACAAARNALDMAGAAAAEVDLVVMATTTPDKIFPSTACLVQKRLGIRGCPAFDVQAVCTGFVYALDMARRVVEDGDARCALVIGAEVLSRILDWNDRATCVLFGDGAGAVVLRAADQPGVMTTRLHADGSHEELLHVPDEHIRMKGSEVFKIAVKTLERVAEETLADAGLERADLDWLVPHQANYRIIAATAKKLKLPMERVVATVAEHGNTSAASIPLALDTAVRDGRIQRGETLMLEAFGGGFTWGAALVKF